MCQGSHCSLTVVNVTMKVIQHVEVILSFGGGSRKRMHHKTDASTILALRKLDGEF